MRSLIASLVVALLGAVRAADAHDAVPGEPLHATLDLAVVLPLAVAALLFAIGWWRLAVRVKLGAPRLRWRAMCFAGGWLVIVVALVSPLHEGGEHSFALHMVEHELLMLLAAPLLVLAEPLGILLWALPPAFRRRVGEWSTAGPVRAAWRASTRPVTATTIQAAALWVWHAPFLFDLALANEGWHIAQHACFLVSALLFWTAMLERHGLATEQRSRRSVAAACLFATSIVSGALGALMAFSQSPWYQGYARLGLSLLGLTPAEDQQLAGLIMWIPGGLVHAVVALVLVRSVLAPAVATVR